MSLFRSLMRFEKRNRIPFPRRNRVYLESLEPRILLSDISLSNVLITPMSLSEGEIATLSGKINDPETEDTFTLAINWGDTQSSQVSLGAAEIDSGGVIWNPGTREFSLDHQYVDNTSGGTISVTDAASGSSATSFTVTVNNVAPKARITSPNGSGEAYVVTTNYLGFSFYTPIEIGVLGTTEQIDTKIDQNIYCCYGAGIGDFDNDNDLEILVGDGTWVPSQYSSNTWYLDKTGPGNSFAPAVSIDSTAHTYRMDFAEADFNGDGNLDAVMADYTTNYFTFYMGNGNGTFNQSTFSAPYGIIGMDAADFNGDGEMDFVAASDKGEGAFVYLGSKNGIFQSPIQLRYARSWGVSAGDFNNDGNADLLFGRSAMFYPGNGDGTFGNGVALGFSNVYAMAEVDINRDEWLDLLYTDGSSLFYRFGIVTENGEFGGFDTAQNVFTDTTDPLHRLYGLAAMQAPLLSSERQFNEGEEVLFTATFKDPGPLDTHTIEWDFGDGAVVSGIMNPTHVYADDGTYTATLTVTDDDGGVGTNSFTIKVLNVVPVLTISGEIEGDEGLVYSLGLASSDPGDDTITSWTITWGDGQIETIEGNPTNVTHTYADGPNTYTISATATDEDGTYDGVNTVGVIVANVTPVVDVGADATICEGGAFTVTGSFTDPGADTWTATVDYGDGTGVQSLLFNPDKTFILSHVYADNGIYTVTVGVSDDEGGVGIDPVQITVNNVAPVITSLTNSALNIGDAKEGQLITLLGAFTDVGISDTHSATIDWGDGTISNGVITEMNGSGSFTGSHMYINGGIYDVKASLLDDDSGITSQVTTALITGVGLNNGIFYIVGTPGKDNVEVKAKGEWVEVKANFLPGKKHTQTFKASEFDRVEIMVGGGNDHVTVDKKISKPVTIDGGAGNDHLKAGGGPTTLRGDVGNDILIGGKADDFLDGGDGNDLLIGGSGKDILIGGNDNDRLLGGRGDDDLSGGNGNDLLVGGPGYDTLDGGEGYDWLIECSVKYKYCHVPKNGGFHHTQASPFGLWVKDFVVSFAGSNNHHIQIVIPSDNKLKGRG